MRNRLSALALLLTTVLAFAACGSGADTATTGETTTSRPAEVDPDDDVIPLTEDISTPVTEQNLAEARHIFDAGKDRWDSYDPFAHTLTLGFDGMSQLRITFDADGTTVSEEVLLGDPADWAVTSVPRSVDALFADLDAIIGAFETGEVSVPEDGECGHHFNARFDSDWGAPLSYNTLGPCDDGVGLSIKIAPVG